MSVRRVCVLGAESTGKSTIARALAEHYDTLWAPEYGAVYHHQIRPEPAAGWTSDEFVHIARVRDWLEDFLAESANRVLLCDTDTFVTAVFHRLYLKAPHPALEAEAAERRYGLYLLCDDDTPFAQDEQGFRRRSARQEMHRTYCEWLRERALPYVLLEGPHEERLARATAAIDALL